MDAGLIINDILVWIESNLDGKMSIDIVSQKAGYSKWHLQRMFSSVTGQKLGNYFRERQLTRIAYILKLTNTSIVDIAISYGFNSQQSLTRAFKNYIGISPGCYRRTNSWFFKGLRPPLSIDKRTFPTSAVVYIPELTFLGATYFHSFLPDDFLEQSIKIHTESWNRFLLHSHFNDNKAYGLIQHQPDSGNRNATRVLYSPTVLQHEDIRNGIKIKRLKINKGKHLKFTFSGVFENLPLFIRDIYNIYLPSLNIVRRNGCDIEMFHIDKCRFEKEGNILCDYFIPVEL
ncbi:hypothetical protein DQY98_20120 [Salmonella enterica subsp. enterica serovar Saintpaul]|nr:hypothetical protein [Salmonella enterica subsp. enterica serovar Saintpaul]EBX0752878.1 hypothetical protein [Salmonella enterica subsp. enterica serovar Saintpaul]ECB0581365.1 helix-turn-helix domain-containing protein [Salmonella enterica subsp. enterica serovar Saintpaul]ECI6579424.1 helix-turn-helix domain-containing protein [Salmonella enterica subsp. enterica serovar Saintpaul]